MKNETTNLKMQIQAITENIKLRLEEHTRETNYLLQILQQRISEFEELNKVELETI